MRISKVDRISRNTPDSISGVLHGVLPNKSNGRRIVRGMSIKSQLAIDFVECVKCVASYSRFGKRLDGATNERDWRRGKPLLYLKVFVYGESFSRDLDVELLQDALQHAGVLNNDRAIRRKAIWWDLDKENPRVVFEVGYLGESWGTSP